MEEIVQSLLNGLLEEFVWKVAVLEHKRAKGFQSFVDQQAERKLGNDKPPPETVHDCPVCGREVSASRFAPHLSKCLGIGGRRQAAKKNVRAESGEAEYGSKASSVPPSDSPTAMGKRQAGNPKKRGRPPKKPQGTPLSAAEHEALLSNAINNATQRLHLQGIGVPMSSKPAPAAPHPLSQSLTAAPPSSKVKRKKKKRDPARHRSRNSSQASSSSDSDEEEEEEDEEDEEEYEEYGEGTNEGRDSITPGPAGKFEEDPTEGSIRMAESERSASTVPAPPPIAPGALERPILKRRSSSQADSSDDSD